MALYHYQGFYKDGKKADGQIDASSAAAVRELLQKQSIYPISIVASHEKGSSATSFFQSLFVQKVPLKDLLIFTKQLAVLLRSGVPLLQSLELLDGQFEGRLRTIIISLKDILREGGSLADGLRQYPDVFENIYVQLVRAGEASGSLEVILDKLVSYMEEREAIQSRVASALRGPIIQLVGILAMALFLTTGVVPKLASVFVGLGTELPAPTQILMAISDFLLNYYMMLVIIVIVGIGLLLYWKSTEEGSYSWDTLMLKVPLVNFFARMNAVVEFCSTLGMLLKAGVRLSEALDIVCNIIDNRVLKKSLLQARDKIIKQGKIAQYLKQTELFPPIAMYLINTGEQSGKLDDMLLEVAKNYTVELREKVEGLSALIDPLMMALMAFIVGFIVLSIALPMVEMSTSMKI